MNNTQKMISAVAHTANYLRLCVKQMQHIEDQVCDVSQQLMILNESNKFGTDDYWKKQQVEIFKIFLSNDCAGYIAEDATLARALMVSNQVVELLKANAEVE